MRRLEEIFYLRYGHSLELNALTQVAAPAGVNFVSRTMRNNGVTARVDVQATPGLAGEITVALGGTPLASCLQPEPFVCGRDVMILTAKDPAMTDVEKLWWCRCIWENRHRYSYGRQANRTLASIVLPEPPSWVQGKIIPANDALRGTVEAYRPLDDFTTWGDFRIESLFIVEKGKRVTKASRQPGGTPFVGALDKKNGVADHCDLDPIFPAHTLTVPYNGNGVGMAFYQDKPYFASDDVQVLRPREDVTRWAMLFVATMIRFEKERFSYGYKWHLERMRATTIRLPVTADGLPDWEGMSRYMRGLPFSATLASEEEQVV